MQPPPAADSGDVRLEGSIAETPLPADISDAVSLIQAGKFVLPALKKVIDAILLSTAIEINYSSMHSYHLIKTDVRNQENPLMAEDVLAGGCCYPHMDCVGSAYFIRDKIITTFRKFDEEGVVYNQACLLSIASLKLEKALTMLCLYRIDKKAPGGYSPGEHVSLTMIMNQSHLLMDVGKLIFSTFLEPGDEAESIPMIRNDINASPLKWRYINLNGLINVKKTGSKTKYVFLPIPCNVSPFVTITHRNALLDRQFYFLQREISKKPVSHLMKMGNFWVGVSVKMGYDSSSKKLLLIVPAQSAMPDVLASMAISAPKSNKLFSEYEFTFVDLEEKTKEAIISALKNMGVDSEGWTEVFESLKSKY